MTRLSIVGIASVCVTTDLKVIPVLSEALRLHQYPNQTLDFIFHISSAITKSVEVL